MDKTKVSFTKSITKWGPRSIAKLVQITPITIWFMVPITIVFMGFINHLITGGPHLVGTSCHHKLLSLQRKGQQHGSILLHIIAMPSQAI